MCFVEPGIRHQTVEIMLCSCRWFPLIIPKARNRTCDQAMSAETEIMVQLTIRAGQGEQL
jgi:hypothetical protein